MQDLDVRATDVDVDLSAGVFAVAVAVAVAAEEVAGARAAAENGLFAAALALSDWRHEVNTLQHETYQE